jgi:hypothetical protein
VGEIRNAYNISVKKELKVYLAHLYITGVMQKDERMRNGLWMSSQIVVNIILKFQVVQKLGNFMSS